ncbi:MAG: pitrilysin family protein [Nitrospirota bacterium]
MVCIPVKRFVCIVVAAFIIIPLSASAAEVREYRLENGLKVLVIEEHKAPVATFQIWYRTGSRNDPAGKTGLSHLLEHMMFRGTRDCSSADFARIIQMNSGEDNAYTTDDYTVYYQVFPSEKVFLSIGLEADRMRNLLLSPDNVEAEKHVVMEERRLEHEDDPHVALFDEVRAIAFKVHPYRRPVIGWMSDLKTIERGDLASYYRTWYAPENAFVVVAGDVRPDEIAGRIEKAFASVPSGAPRIPVGTDEPIQEGARRVSLKREAETQYVLRAYHTPVFPDEDYFALDILQYILAGGKSSRLYRSLVYEKKVALEADAEYIGLSRDSSLFLIDAKAAPGTDIRKLETALGAEIEIIRTVPLSEYEITKARNQIEADYVTGKDSVETLAERYAVFEMLGDWRHANRYLERIRQVTPGDIMKAAERYFTDDNSITGILIPRENGQP